jgi:glyoxylase I family protein
MRKVEGVGGIFSRAKDTRALSEWYEMHLGIDILNGVWMASGGPTVSCHLKRIPIILGGTTNNG